MSISRTKNVIKNFSKEPVDFILLIVVFIMLALGLIMVMSASSPRSIAESGNSYEYVKTQALSAGLGLIAMIIISKIDYKIYKNFYKIIYIAVIILLASVALIGASDGRSKKMDKFGIYKFSTIRTCKDWINSFLCYVIN
jgi:cell division protein FtsW